MTRIKRLLSSLVACCMVLMLLPVSALAANTANRDNFITDFQKMDHSGWTAVSTAEDLKNISSDLSGAYYLTGDIDLSGEEWVPLGSQSKPFTGTLDGCGYVIRNLTITGRNGRNDFGLFGAARNAQIFDLGLENVNIKVNSDSQGSTTASNVGGLVGYATSTAGGATVLVNCYVTGTVSFNSSGESAGYVGGLVGRAETNRYSSTYGSSVMVSASYNRAKVTGSGYSCAVDAGGLVGYAHSKDEYGRLGMQYCFNTGAVTAYASTAYTTAGGLVGSNYSSSSIHVCYNAGDIFTTGGQGMGGMYRSSFLAGGLVGDNGNAVLIHGSYNYGDVTAENTDSTNDCDVVAGGLVGQGNYQTGVEQSYNAGEVSAEGNYGAARAGGLAGLINAIREDYNLRSGAYFTDSFVLSDSVAVYGRADVSKAALVYTTDAEPGKWVDNGFGNIWQEGTKDTVTKNTALAVDDISGNAEDNAKGGKITRAQASQWSTYAAEGWTRDDWQSVSDCPYPQLFFQNETLGYTGGAVRGELGGTVTIDNPAPRMGDTLTAVTTGLTVTPDEAEMGALSYQWMRSGSAISGAVGASYQLTAQDVGHTISVAVQASNCTGTVTSDPTASVGKGIYSGTAQLTQNIRVGETGGSVDVNLNRLVPDALNPSYTYVGMTDTDGILSGEPAISGSTMTVTYNPVYEVDKTASIDLKIASDTYEEINAVVTIRSANKDVLPEGAILCGDVSVPYSGESQGVGPASVTGEYTGGEFTFTYQYQGQGYDSTTPPTDVGTYTVTITAENDDYLGTATAALTITPKALSAEMASVSRVTYDGQGHTPALLVEDGGSTLVQDRDYTAALTERTAAGTYPVEITGMGNYTGTITVDFVIDPKDIAGAAVTLPQDGFVYTGSPVEPEVTSVTVDGLTLSQGDYTVSYTNNTAVGVGTVTVTGQGNFTGTAEKDFVITESDYYFSITAPKTMVVGQNASASAALVGLESAPAYDHALIQITVEGPEGAKPQILATDTTGQEHNLAEVGQWGPDGGFHVEAGYRADTPLKLVFDQPGTYKATFQLVDLDQDRAVLGGGSFQITVGHAYTFDIEAPDTLRPNQSGQGSATLKGDPNAPAYAHALIQIAVESPEGAKPQILATDETGKEYNLAEVGQWGPDGGFPVSANYSAKTDLKLVFDQKGTYKATFQLVDLDSGKVIGAGEKTIEVRNPSSGGSSSTYAIKVEESEHGKVTSSSTWASQGATVTLTVQPDEGYVLDTLTVTDRDGEERKLTEKSENKYTFTMPDTSVTVEATFVEEGAVTLPFTDVKESDWYYEAVCYTYEHHMMTGTSDTRFAPAANLTRGMIAQVLYNLEEKPAAAGTSFVDVPADAWYAKAVNWAASAGIVDGYGSGKFGPEDPVTREQMAAILYRYAQYKDYDVTATADLSAFADRDKISGWAEHAMSWAVGDGLLNGKTATILDPTGTATRAEVAQILMNFAENTAK